MSLVLSSTEWTTESTAIVLKLLEDKRVEVREKAAEVLGGLLHCDFINNTDELLVSWVNDKSSDSIPISSFNNFYFIL